MNFEIKETTAMLIPLRDGYVLSGTVNATNRKRSWWMTKEGYTKATYCFSTFGYGNLMRRDLDAQMDSIEEYISLFNVILGVAEK